VAIELSKLKKALDGELDGTQVEQLLEAYSAKEAQESNLDGFLSFLLAERHLSIDRWQRIHANSAIDLTPELPPLPQPRAPLAAGEADSTRPAPTATPLAPMQIEPHRLSQNWHDLMGQIGEGSMGTVHLARDQELRRKVAIKELRPTLAAQSKLAARFLYEAQLTAQLDHPNVVPVYALERRDDRSVAYTMKLVQDVAFSQHYQKAISIEWPVYKLAPGVELKTVARQLQHLARIGKRMRNLTLRSENGQAPAMSPKAQRRLLMTDGAPLIWCYVGLASGVHFCFPGKTGYPASYDPRQRPWYKLSANKIGVYWGNPYRDIGDQGLILPCTTSIWRGKELLGVAGVEMTFKYLIRELLSLEHKAVNETFLLDRGARVVVRSSEAVLGVERSKLNRSGGLKLPLFHLQPVVDAIAQNRSGMMKVTHGGKQLMVAYHRLEALGWYYVVIADSRRLLPTK